MADISSAGNSSAVCSLADGSSLPESSDSLLADSSLADILLAGSLSAECLSADDGWLLYSSMPDCLSADILLAEAAFNKSKADLCLSIQGQERTRFRPNRPAADMEGNGEFDSWVTFEDFWRYY